MILLWNDANFLFAVFEVGLKFEAKKLVFIFMFGSLYLMNFTSLVALVSICELKNGSIFKCSDSWVTERLMCSALVCR